MANYSDNLAAMQEDALNRVREMQRRARQRVEQEQFEPSNPPLIPEPVKPNGKQSPMAGRPRQQEKKKKHVEQKAPHVENEEPGLFGGGGMFSSLAKKILPDMDSDRIFLLVLLMMLQGQKADHGLMLALFYIMT